MKKGKKKNSKKIPTTRQKKPDEQKKRLSRKSSEPIHLTPRPVLMYHRQRVRSYLGRQVTDKRSL